MTELYAQAVTASHRERWTRERTDVHRRSRRHVRRPRRFGRTAHRPADS